MAGISTAFMRKHYFSFILFFIVIHPELKASEKDSIPRFDNAYYLAKAITSYNQAATSDSMAKMLLSGILWYMEDDRTPDPSQQEIALDKYPVIRKYYDSLLKRFKKDEDIFTIELDVLRLCIQKFNAQDRQQLNDFIELRKEYDELITDSSSVNSQIRKLWDNRKTYMEYLEYEEINLKRLKREKVVDSIHLLENTIQRYKGLLTQNRADYKKLAEDSSNHTVNLKRVRNEIHGLKSFTDKIHLKCLINAGVSASRIYEIATDRGWIEYKESISKREPESEPVEMSPLSFKMPSQSDIIDAL